MFEYLMPLLVMPTYAHTLLDYSYRAVVERQMAYGRECGVPCSYARGAVRLPLRTVAIGNRHCLPVRLPL